MFDTMINDSDVLEAVRIGSCIIENYDFVIERYNKSHKPYLIADWAITGVDFRHDRAFYRLTITRRIDNTSFRVDAIYYDYEDEDSNVEIANINEL